MRLRLRQDATWSLQFDKKLGLTSPRKSSQLKRRRAHKTARVITEYILFVGSAEEIVIQPVVKIGVEGNAYRAGPGWQFISIGRQAGLHHFDRYLSHAGCCAAFVSPVCFEGFCAIVDSNVNLTCFLNDFHAHNQLVCASCAA